MSYSISKDELLITISQDVVFNVESDWTTTPEEWEKARRCHNCGRQLFPTNARSAEVWAVSAFHKWMTTGISPESQHDLRALGLLEQLHRRGHHHPLT